MFTKVKPKFIFLVFILILVFSAPTFATSRFSDVHDNHWAYQSISDLADKKVISGYENGTFQPSKTVTRAELATILVKAAGLKTINVSKSTFSDVDSEAWYTNNIETAKEYLEGTTRNGIQVFYPDKAATREEITTAVVKVLGFTAKEANIEYLDKFTDKNDVTDQFEAYIAIAIEKGIINGHPDKNFYPKVPVSRAEAAFIIWRAFNEGKDIASYETQIDTSTNQGIKAFEGQWSTPQSDALAFELSFIDDKKGVITFFTEGEASPNNIEYVYDGQKIIYNYGEKNKLVTLELIDSKTMIFIDYNGYKLTLTKAEATETKASSSVTSGLWVTKENINKTEQQFFNDGGNFFKLKSYENGVLQGDFFHISAAPANRIAGVEGLNCKITNGKGTFHYEDDGFGNKGEGTVEITEESIIFSFKETEADKMAMWNLGTFVVTLYKSTKE